MPTQLEIIEGYESSRKRERTGKCRVCGKKLVGSQIDFCCHNHLQRYHYHKDVGWGEWEDYRHVAKNFQSHKNERIASRLFVIGMKQKQGLLPTDEPKEQ